MPRSHPPDCGGVAPDEDLSLSGTTRVYRYGKVIVKDAGPWTSTVHSLLRHLEAVGFPAAPRVLGSSFDASGRETLTYLEGEFIGERPWTLEGLIAVAAMIRDLHHATASYAPPPNAIWQPWFGRPLGEAPRVISHCDVAPWNIVARHGLPVALIDWEHAGPVDPLIELAQACWLNAKLHHDAIAAREGLPPLAARARHLRAMVDAYGLNADQRHVLFDRIIEFVVHDTAEQADEAGIAPDMTEPDVELLGYDPLWALAWRARDAAWLIRNRRTLQNALA